jgi:ribonucleoside-triphosphate reductase (thioredoxin)
MTLKMVESLITESNRVVLKRDGVTFEKFESEKLYRAICGAWREVQPVDDKALRTVLNTALSFLANDERTTVENVQDVVEISLMQHKHFSVAKAFILYRQARAEARHLRGKSPDPLAISSYIHASKYAKYLPKKQRREVYEETVARDEDMHISRFPMLKSQINEAFDLVRSKHVLPSMRSMQFGGEAILKNHNRIYNCTFTFVDRLTAFSQAMFLLLCGSGVGYSVQFDHVDKLPSIGYVDAKRIRHHVIADSIEGWADAVEALVQSYSEGVYVEFSYHKIRDAGQPLKTSGGKAPGHTQLKSSIERIRLVLDGAQGRRLRPIECHRIMCHCADAVLSGGIRRSAMICLFSLGDSEMLYSKTGKWWQSDPWFSNANNSVVLKRDDTKKSQFKRIFQMTKEWGEPGFYFTEDYDYGTNPCCEIGLNPKLVIDETIREELRAKGIDVALGETFTGWAFCNLCEINASKLTSLEDFLKVAKAATFIGTLQATYTKMPYLGWVSEAIAERESLLGIGMTGMLDAPDISCNPSYQRQVAKQIKVWNKQFADQLGIKPAARTTCVKPSGTTSLELGSVGSGHHPHHARRYIRRVIADELEPVFQAFKAVNPHMVVRKPDGKFVIEFPVEAPARATVRADVNAEQFLKMVRSTQLNWVIPGINNSEHSPGLTHNVSNTVTVKADEWELVADFIWEHRQDFTGVSLLSSTGDKQYAFAPNEEVVTDADEARWNAILAKYTPIDYTKLIEEDDSTDLSGELACAGGLCEI